jgi:hypothetical protein
MHVFRLLFFFSALDGYIRSCFAPGPSTRGTQRQLLYYVIKKNFSWVLYSILLPSADRGEMASTVLGAWEGD